ncbi:MAG: His-Xaa-Ser system protein HxsD [Colwellia sp.]
MILSYLKTNVSEVALRKALYWVPSSTIWSLSDQGDMWEVSFEIDKKTKECDEVKHQFEKSLNDYILRDVLDSKTNALKQAIIRKSLKDLSSDE